LPEVAAGVTVQSTCLPGYREITEAKVVLLALGII
jgi:hypothetical protein